MPQNKNQRWKIVLIIFTFLIVALIPILLVVKTELQPADKINSIVAILAFLGLAIALFQPLIQTLLIHPDLNLVYKHAPPDCYMSLITEAQKDEIFEKRRQLLEKQQPPSWETLIGVRDTALIEQLGNAAEKYKENFYTLNSTRDKYQTSRHYFRVRVSNSGNTKAESIEVFASQLERETKDGEFQIVEKFLPVNLGWTHSEDILLNSMAPGIEKTCDIGFINDPEEMPDDFYKTLKIQKFEAVFCLSVGKQTNFINYILTPGTYHLQLIVAAANAKPKIYILEIEFSGKWYQENEKMLKEGISIKLLK